MAKDEKHIVIQSLNDTDKQAVNNYALVFGGYYERTLPEGKIFTALRSSAEHTEEMLSEWIHIAEISSLEDFQHCTRTLKSWFDGIISSFAYNYTNGFLPKAATTKSKY